MKKTTTATTTAARRRALTSRPSYSPVVKSFLVRETDGPDGAYFFSCTLQDGRVVSMVVPK